MGTNKSKSRETNQQVELTYEQLRKQLWTNVNQIVFPEGEEVMVGTSKWVKNMKECATHMDKEIRALS